MSYDIYHQTFEMFTYLKNLGHIQQDIELIACFSLVCKMMTETYPRIEYLEKTTGILKENIIRMESNIFLLLGMKI
jgi:hypothetical protein